MQVEAVNSRPSLRSWPASREPSKFILAVKNFGGGGPTAPAARAFAKNTQP